MKSSKPSLDFLDESFLFWLGIVLAGRFGCLSLFPPFSQLFLAFPHSFSHLWRHPTAVVDIIVFVRQIIDFHGGLLFGFFNSLSLLLLSLLSRVLFSNSPLRPILRAFIDKLKFFPGLWLEIIISSIIAAFRQIGGGSVLTLGPVCTSKSMNAFLSTHFLSILLYWGFLLGNLYDDFW